MAGVAYECTQTQGLCSVEMSRIDRPDQTSLHCNPMATFTVTQAKAQLSAIIQRVIERGEEAVISRAGRPAVRLTRFEAKRPKRWLNLFKGKIKIAKDFDRWPADLARAFGITDD